MYTHILKKKKKKRGDNIGACKPKSGIRIIPPLPGEGNGNPLQYSCLENAMDRRTWQATDHEVTTSQTGLSD